MLHRLTNVDIIICLLQSKIFVTYIDKNKYNTHK
jgi:hypothetical protein